MRKIFVLLLIIGALPLFAEQVSLQQAQEVAGQFFTQRAQKQGLRRRALQAASSEQNATYYIFNRENGGFVIIAGSTCAHPVLGFSDTGSLSVDSLSSNVAGWLQSYSRDIERTMNDTPDADILAEWENIAAYTAATIVVSPLIQTAWDQDSPYNSFCPTIPNSTAHAVTGCVATAMAQIMCYWKYPTQGSGSYSYTDPTYGTLYADFGNTTYNWSSMPRSLSRSATSSQKKAVGILMYHCGVSVAMEYSPDSETGSGASLLDLSKYYDRYPHESAEHAFYTYFGYKETLEGASRLQYSDSKWKKKLKHDLDNARPVIYAGANDESGGHCFILDGYNSEDYFHINFGWSGIGDGYYLLDAIKVQIGGAGAGGLDYSNMDYQQAIFGVEPKGIVDPLYVELTLQSISAPDSMMLGAQAKAACSFINSSSEAFDGLIGVALYDSQFQMVMVMDSMTMQLQSGGSSMFSRKITIADTMKCDNYSLVFVYRTNDGAWTPMEGDNYHAFKIYDIPQGVVDASAEDVPTRIIDIRGNVLYDPANAQRTRVVLQL